MAPKKETMKKFNELLLQREQGAPIRQDSVVTIVDLSKANQKSASDLRFRAVLILGFHEAALFA